MQRKKKKQPLLKRSKFRYYRKVIIWLIFVATLLYGISFWSGHASMKVTDVVAQGNRFVETQKIEDIFFETISGKHLFLISRSNFLFLPKDDITKKLEKILEIDSVDIKRLDFNTFVIEISEHNPVAEYCVEAKCYLVNNEGLIFEEKPDVFLDNLILLEGKIGGNVNGEDEQNEQDEQESDQDEQIEILGQSFSDKKTFKKLLEKIDLLIEENIEISKISTEDFETYRLQTVGGPVLLIEEQDIPKTVISNLKAALAQESIHEIQFDQIDYIDLRFEDKVFYKLK